MSDDHDEEKEEELSVIPSRFYRLLGRVGRDTPETFYFCLCEDIPFKCFTRKQKRLVSA